MTTAKHTFSFSVFYRVRMSENLSAAQTAARMRNAVDVFTVAVQPTGIEIPIIAGDFQESGDILHVDAFATATAMRTIARYAGVHASDVSQLDIDIEVGGRYLCTQLALFAQRLAKWSFGMSIMPGVDATISKYVPFRRNTCS